MVGLTATAYTPDGKTPAVETVCDPLTTEGVTQGLYGLCLAFCDAQDIASEELPITEADLDALMGAASSGSILDSYNMIKKTTDPYMPCIKVDASCPCWTADELDSIDGITPAGDISRTRCAKATDPQSGTVDVATAIEIDPQRIRATAWDLHRENDTIERCTYSNAQVTPPIARDLDVRQGTLTHYQAAECLAQINARCATLGY